MGDADVRHVLPNLQRLVEDAGIEWGSVVVSVDDEWGGRWPCLLVLGGRECWVAMPGLPLERVRYMGEPQNIWDFPRLYVDGDSWVWEFAIGWVRGILDGTHDEE